MYSFLEGRTASTTYQTNTNDYRQKHHPAHVLHLQWVVMVWVLVGVHAQKEPRNQKRKDCEEAEALRAGFASAAAQHDMRLCTATHSSVSSMHARVPFQRKLSNAAECEAPNYARK